MRSRPYAAAVYCAAAAIVMTWVSASSSAAVGEAAPLYAAPLAATPYGRLPAGWRDVVAHRPNRNWAVDGRGLLRHTLKLATGLAAYEGPLVDGRSASELTDARIVATFQKTEDVEVSFGVAARIVDDAHYYLARFGGDDRLELLRVKAGRGEPLDYVTPADGVAVRPSGLVALTRYRYPQRWTLSLEVRGNRLTAVVLDAEGRETARLDAQDDTYRQGPAGLCATTFAAAATFRIEPIDTPGEPAAPRSDKRLKPAAPPSPATAEPDYADDRPAENISALNTPHDRLSSDYDVIVAGAGTGGCAAAIQAARLGTKVLLLEETDWIGGQMCAAAVTTMDEDSVYHKFPVRERGLYREFHESIALYYHTLDKDPYVAYYGNPYQMEGGYEPKAARAVLYGLIAAARDLAPVAGRRPVLDVALRARVAKVRKQGNTVVGATLELAAADGARRTHEAACRVLIDATEYGDVIPLTGAKYRVGNSISDRVDPKSLVQDHTWTAVVREYPEGVPPELRIAAPPPGYEEGAARRFKKFQLHGLSLYGAAGKGIKGPRSYRVYFTWRGMADADGPLLGLRSGLRHTQCGFNGGNDYPVTAATIVDPAQRLVDEREGIYKTLGALYYFQHELGLNWALAADEGYDTPYNREKMKQLALRSDLAAVAVHLPQQPYVRECRRIVGVRTLVAADLTRYEAAKHFATSVAMGDYFMDLDHGRTAHAVEADLDSGEPPHGGGPFQVPFEVFLPETIDGFIPAEKNISQSRLANGATRLQPITMLMGQAAGVIAALAVQNQVQPRALDPRQVQGELLAAGSTLVQRWYADVPWGSPLWRATQLLSLYQVLDRPGPITRDDRPLGAVHYWGVDQGLTQAELHAALSRLCELCGASAAKIDRIDAAATEPVTLRQLRAQLKAADERWPKLLQSVDVADADRITAGEFALVAAPILLLPRAP